MMVGSSVRPIRKIWVSLPLTRKNSPAAARARVVRSISQKGDSRPRPPARTCRRVGTERRFRYRAMAGSAGVKSSRNSRDPMGYCAPAPNSAPRKSTSSVSAGLRLLAASSSPRARATLIEPSRSRLASAGWSSGTASSSVSRRSPATVATSTCEKEWFWSDSRKSRRRVGTPSSRRRSSANCRTPRSAAEPSSRGYSCCSRA